MILIEASRRATRAAVERLREAFLEYDRVVFKEVTPAAEDAYVVIREGKGRYVLALVDPTVGQ
jgi:hypothetical protein